MGRRLSRAFLRWQAYPDLSAVVGRFDNPFFTAGDMVWNRDLGFDGFAVKAKTPVTTDLSAFSFRQLEMRDHAAVDALAEGLSGLDVLVNNAGANFPRTTKNAPRASRFPSDASILLRRMLIFPPRRSTRRPALILSYVDFRLMFV